MHVTNYQIEKVLNVYTRKLGRNDEAEKGERLTRTLGQDRISLSAEGKRRAVLERVSAEILEKLSQEGTLGHSGPAETASGRSTAGAKSATADAFIYNVIGEDQEKATTAISLADDGLFMQP